MIRRGERREPALGGRGTPAPGMAAAVATRCAARAARAPRPRNEAARSTMYVNVMCRVGILFSKITKKCERQCCTFTSSDKPMINQIK